MEPLITNRLDPALLRIVEKRGNDRDAPARRRRPPASEPPAKAEQENSEPNPHEIDDLA